MQKIPFFLFLIAVVTVSIILDQSKLHTTQNEKRVLQYFYLPSCHDCLEQEDELKILLNEHRDISISYYDITVPESLAFYRKLAGSAGIPGTSYGIPAVYFGNTMHIGLTSASKILSGVSVSERDVPAQSFSVPFVGSVAVSSVSLPVLAVLMGLVDGINPCAMWVLVYLIGLVSGLRDKRIITFIVGTFVAASGILYFLFMSAWLNVFLLSSSIRIVKIGIGAFAFGSGIWGISSLVQTRGALTCDIGNPGQRKKLMDSMKDIVKRPFSIALVFGIIGLAFVVNSIEFLCSSALPALFTGVLTEQKLPAIQYYGYIGLYTVFFMLDDLVVFSLAVFAISKTFETRYAAISRWIGNILMAVLGFLLLFFPRLL